ncbi:hypothetical protein Zm00014a_029740 [Zea mays]|uniref:Uncharacterized protein n=1 Tax=Zea mays TaxID=4577 RepID=A0A317Y9E1_MAIZE|nr:hypothetical protein Zm00014a_029740 [Zea mays]
MNSIASYSGLVSSSLNFTSISWYATMNWSSSGSVAAARPLSVACCRVSTSCAISVSLADTSGGAPTLLHSR